MPQKSCWAKYNPWRVWLKLCRFCNHVIERFFAKLGEVVANYPLVTLFLSFATMCLLGLGFLYMETENRTERLYIPQTSESITNLRKAKDYGFYRASRVTQVILINKKGQNVLTKECFQDALFLHKLITNISGYTKLCLPIKKGDHPVVPSQCATQEPLRIFNYSFNNLEDIPSKLNALQSSNAMLFRTVIGKVSRNTAGQIRSAGAIRLIYYLKGSNLEDVSKKTTDWEEDFVNRMKSLDSRVVKCGPISFTTGRSMDDSITESSRSDIKLISLTFAIMISFACLMHAKLKNPLTGHGLLAVGGVLSVCCGIIAGFGLTLLTHTPYISIVGILPFLVLGVGIDNMFIIVDQLDRSHPDQTVPKRLGSVMRHVGPAVTMTTMTDLLAFVVGTSSKFPSIVYFCTYAGLAILFAFFFLVTIFVAFMAFDCKRMAAGRRDIIPCLHVPIVGSGCMGSCLKTPKDVLLNQRWDEPSPQILNKIMELWGRFLMKPMTKIVVVVVSLSLLGASFYATNFISEEFDRRDLAKDGSEFIKFLDTSEAYFADDIPVDLVLESGLDYSDPSTQGRLNYLSDIVAKNKFYRPIMVSWFNEFQEWRISNGFPTNTSNFLPFLRRFLNTHPRFKSDILFSSDNSTIKASRFYCFMKETSSGIARRDSMVTLRRDISEKSDLPVFASAYVFILFEQYVLTLPETIRNLSLAAMAIALVTSLFLVSPVVVLLVVLGFVSLIFELLGLMYIWGVSLNSISMINLVMAIGFAVDYSAHVAHAFVFSREANPEGRVVEALRTMGASVFMGGFSTFLGMVITGFASSEIFRIFFKMFFGIVVLGLLHGLCFLPVWLSIISRHHVNVLFDEQDQDETDHGPLATTAM